ncbi:synaptic vesicle 2-related protein-like [Diadema antillarum]|uniref:synaptic vesicle 2-related protein-like n=1 Tax=Diadema antillarum TaxID=105358 RepID=UPI003A8777B1
MACALPRSAALGLVCSWQPHDGATGAAIKKMDGDIQYSSATLSLSNGDSDSDDNETERSRLHKPVDNDDEEVFTVEEAVDALGFGWFQIRVCFIVGFHGMADAFEIMLVSVLSDKLRCEWRLSSWQQALMTTVIFGGYFLSAPVWGALADKFGRRGTLGLCSFLVFYFGLLSSFSPTFTWLLILRGLVGTSLGGASQGFTILAELLPSKTRGLCLVFLTVFWIVGICLQVILTLIIMPTLGWRYLMFFSSFPLLIFLLLMKYLPESVLYQQTMGDFDGAMATLRLISSLNKRPLPRGHLCRNVREWKPKGSLPELFKTRTMAITSSLLLINWFCNAFLYYGMVLLATEIFSSGNTCASEPAPEMECFAACKSLDVSGYVHVLETSFAEFPGVLITFVIIEVLGRRKTMAIQMWAAGLFTFLLLICTTSGVQTFFIFVVRGMISGAFQALYVYTPEVYPTHVRSLSLGVCVAASRLGAIVTPFVAQVLMKNSSTVAICVYAGFALLSGVVSVILPLETTGKILH